MLAAGTARGVHASGIDVATRVALGLALSKAIVEMHAGTIRAGSDGLGKGATFAIDLPIHGTNR